MRGLGPRRRMARVRTVLYAAIAGVLVLVVAACGGSCSSSDTTSTTTTEPTTTASSDGGGAGGKLSASEWSTLQAAAAQARSVNQTNIKTFQGCRTKVAAGGPTNERSARAAGARPTPPPAPRPPIHTP